MTQKKNSQTSSKRKAKIESAAEVVVIAEITDDCTDECDHDKGICVVEETAPEPEPIVEEAVVVVPEPIVEEPAAVIPEPQQELNKVLYGAARLRARRGR